MNFETVFFSWLQLIWTQESYNRTFAWRISSFRRYLSVFFKTFSIDMMTVLGLTPRCHWYHGVLHITIWHKGVQQAVCNYTFYCFVWDKGMKQIVCQNIASTLYLNSRNKVFLSILYVSFTPCCPWQYGVKSTYLC